MNNDGETDAPEGSFTAVSAGANHTCGLRDTGAIECWGDNYTMQITEEGEEHVYYTGQSDASAGSFTAVSAGDAHTCAIRTNGEIACWGISEGEWHYGQTAAPAGSFITVSAGSTHTCAIRAGSGAIECWGDNRRGQIDAPAGSFTAVSAGSDHTCVIRTSGEITCWGWYVGQINAPEGGFTAISAGHGGCGLRSDGAISCWGRAQSFSNKLPAGRYTAVSVGGGHACAIRDTGAIRCWGANNDGQTDVPTE